MTTISSLRIGEENEASSLVIKVFNKFIAKDYSEEGLRTFIEFASSNRIKASLEQGNIILTAKVKDKLIGIIEMRNDFHITLFFVLEENQRQGIGKKLLYKALQICRQRVPDFKNITVNSAPYTIPIYKKLGFIETGPCEIKQGIIFTPMEYVI